MALTAVTPDFINRMRAVLPETALRGADPHYFEEPRGRWRGEAGVVVAPQTVNQVADVITAANAARVPVVPYGGGTGLVGGQIYPDGPAPVLLSLERMSAIRAVYPDENLMIAESVVAVDATADAAIARCAAALRKN